MLVTVNKHNENLKWMNLPMGAVGGASIEELKQHIAGSYAPSSGIKTMQNALFQYNSDFTDFSVLTPPFGAETYDSLIYKYFQQSQAALNSWLHFWQAKMQNLKPDSSFVEEGNRHYRDAAEFLSQVEKEKQKILDKISK